MFRIAANIAVMDSEKGITDILGQYILKEIRSNSSKKTTIFWNSNQNVFNSTSFIY